MIKSFLLLVFLSFLIGSGNIFAQGLDPALLAPADNSRCLDKTIDFEWELKPSVVNYQLQVSTVSGDYSSPVINEPGLTDTEYRATVPDNDVTYYWRVRANYSGTFAWSEEFSFNTKIDGTNTLLPSEGTQCLSNPVYFEWGIMPSVSSYHVQISTNQSFAGAEINNTNVSSNTFSTPLNSSFTNYFWRVRANYSSGTVSCVSEWSNSSSFRSAVQAPDLLTPADNSTGVNFIVDFSWQEKNGSSSYTLQIADDINFTNIIDETTGLTVNNALKTLPSDYNKSYYWRVKAIANTGCESNWSETFTFKTKYRDVALVSPANDEECVPVNNAELIWEAPEGVTSYRLQISETAGFPTPVQFNFSNVTSNTYTFDLPASLTNFYWRVRAEDSTNIGDWSVSRVFKSGLFSPNLNLPVDDSTETFIKTQLFWESQNSISNYNLQVATSSDFDEEDLVLDTANLIDENYEITLDEYGQTYYWRVSSTFSNCLSNWSDVFSFTTMTGTANLVSPLNNATATQLSMLFDWEDVKYAINYDLEISTSQNFDVIEKGRIGIDTSLILISGLKPETQYYWRVRANTGISKAPYSVVRTFTTGVEPSIRPIKISPKNLTNKVPINEVFRWFRSIKADFYEIQIAKDENFTDLAISQNNITDTTFIVSDLENYTTYSWRIRSGNSSGVSAWTEPWKFRTIAAAVSESPALESPADGANEINHKKAEFAWFEVENTTSVNGAYHLQISTSDDFADGTIVVDTRAVYVNEHTVFSLDHTTEYFWRVRGFNEVGDGPWSDTWSFNTLDFTSVSSDFIKNVQLYPNPVTIDKFRVEFNLVESGNTTIKIIDIKGNLITSNDLKFRNSGLNSTEIDVRNLSNGNYFVIIENNGKKVVNSFKVMR